MQKVIEAEDLLVEFNKSPERKSDERVRVLDGIKKNKPIYICNVCKQPVSLCGGYHDENHSGNSFRTIHFKHYHPNSNCPLCHFEWQHSRKVIDRMKFHGQKEGATHLKLKKIISESLEREGYNVFVEQRVTLMQLYQDGFDSENFYRYWRKPDIRAQKGDIKFVVEIQLATTYLSVILERMAFYRDAHYHIIWVLEVFDPNEKQKFTTMDILSMTNRNIFVLDAEMRMETQKTGRLTLRCYYEKPVLSESRIISYVWESKIVHMEDVILDDRNYIGYCYNCWEEEQKLQKQIVNEDPKDILVDSIVLYHPNWEEATWGTKNKKYSWEYSNPEEYFIDLVKSEIRDLCDYQLSYYREFYKDILNNNIAKIEFSLDYCFRKKVNCPPISTDFFYSLLMLYQKDNQYSQLVRVILSHPFFSYPFNEVFDQVNNPFDLAWDLSNNYEQMQKFLNLFYRSDYWISPNDRKECITRLNQNIRKDNTILAEQAAVEKYILVIMYDRIMQHHRKEEFLEMLNCSQVTPQMLRLAAYCIGHPLACNLPNLQSMTNTFWNYHNDFAHLAIKMIELYGWNKSDKFRKNYLRLKNIPDFKMNHQYDDLAKVLFEKLL